MCREFQSKEWEDGAVVYDLASGDTHHLTLAAAEILELIHIGACTQAEITQCMARDAVAVDTETLLAIDAILANLTDLGFIEAITH